MRKYIFLLALLIFTALLALPASAAITPERLVVVLHSYHQGFKWTDDIARGISEVLSHSPVSIEFIHEYMDVKRRWDDEYKKRLISVYQYKYKNRKVDAVILSDNVAFDSMREVGNEIFPGAKVFFCGVNFLSPEAIADYPNFTGISEIIDVAANLELIMKLQPKIKKAAFIVDATETGLIISEHLEQQRQLLAGRLDIEQMTDYTFAELEERLKKLPDDTAVIWSIFFRDRENVFYEFDEGIERVVKACRVPVYCLWDFSIGHGAVGGYLSSGHEQGTSVARMVLRYFAGEPFKNLPVRYEPVTLPIFEWQALQKHGIPLSSLPAGATIVGMPATIYQQYRWWVISGISLIVTLALLSLILSYLVKVRTRQISIARDRAEAASRAKSQFLANMSHELRTPLNGVIGFTDLLQHARLDESEQKYLQNANMSARSLLGIINNILDFSKIEAGKLELDCVKTDIKSLIEQTMAVVRYSADIKNLAIRTELADNLPCCFYVDPIRLGQILINLLGNAVKFTERGSVTLKLEFEDQGDDSGVFAFSVIDTGVGISQESHRQIFEEFSQADNSSTRRYGGTGLGLTITRNLVEKMGGQLLFESEPGHGSRFYFSIKTKSSDSSNCRDFTTVKQQLSQNTSDKATEILIVEDVSLNMLLLKEICARLAPAASLVEAVNGAEALDKYKKRPAQIIFMDLHMPDMDGYQACTEIRRYERERGLARSAIIALTAGALIDEKDKCLAAGMNDFVTKPIEPAMIMAIIEKYSRNA